MVLECVRVSAGRRFHGCHGEQLQEMIDNHVAERTDRIVEVAAILHAKLLGHRDLDVVDEVAIPDWLEHGVREAQIQDLLEAHLAEVVVDAQDLRLVEVLVKLARQRAR